MLWHSLCNELQDWLDRKILEFVLHENRSTKLSDEQWVQKYIYTEVHGIFFFSFAHEIHEWLSRLAKFHNCIKDDIVAEWNPKLIQRVEKFDNKITRTVDHWIDHLLGGFLTEFSIDQFVSYSEAERRFFKGPRGKFLCSMQLLWKMLLCEQGFLCEHTA